MKIRVATNRDRDSIYQIHYSAFPEVERELIAQLAVNLQAETITTPPVISLVAEIANTVVGHVACSPIFTAEAKDFLGYILAPLAVRPEYQNSGLGSQLVKQAIQQLSQMDINILLVYGDPNYYGRFGFHADLAESYLPPYELEYAFGWQALKLNDSEITNLPVKITCVEALEDPQLW